MVKYDFRNQPLWGREVRTGDKGDHSRNSREESVSRPGHGSVDKGCSTKPDDLNLITRAPMVENGSTSTSCLPISLYTHMWTHTDTINK